MIKGWAGVALLVAWLGAAGLAEGQGPPMPSDPGAMPPGPGGYPAPFAPPGNPGGPGQPGPPQGPTPPADEPPAEPANNAFNQPSECGCRPTRLGFDVEYLHWWLKPEGAPPLLTSGSINDPLPGALGQPGTSTLVGGSVPLNSASGLRLSANYALTDKGLLTLDASGFIMENTVTHFTAASTGSTTSQVLARPFYNPNAKAEDADPVGLPGIEAGTANVDTLTRFMGAEANLRLNEPVNWPGGMRWSMLGGARFLGLDDRLGISDSVHDLPLNVAPSQNYFFSDTFTTYNRFYGAQGGLEMAFRAGQMSLDVLAKLAAGQTEETVKTAGFTQITDSRGVVIGQANDRGLLVQPTNNGSLTDHHFSLVPEVAVNWSFNFNPNFRLFAGYTFLYWTSVARPGDQIDRVVSVQPVPAPGGANPPQLGAARPVLLPPQQGSFWAQGLNVGLEFRY